MACLAHVWMARLARRGRGTARVAVALFTLAWLCVLSRAQTTSYVGTDAPMPPPTPEPPPSPPPAPPAPPPPNPPPQLKYDEAVCVSNFQSSAGNDTTIKYENNAFDSVLLGDASTTGYLPKGVAPATGCPSGETVCVELDNERAPDEDIAESDPELVMGRYTPASYFSPTDPLVLRTPAQHATFSYRRVVSQHRFREGQSLRWSFALLPAYNATTSLELRPEGIDTEAGGIVIAFMSREEMVALGPRERRVLSHGPPPAMLAQELDAEQFDAIYGTAALAPWPAGRWLRVDLWLHIGATVDDILYSVHLDGRRLGEWQLLAPPAAVGRLAVTVEAPYETGRRHKACVDDISLIRYDRQAALGDSVLYGSALSGESSNGTWGASRLPLFEQRTSRDISSLAPTADPVFVLDLDDLDANSTADQAEYEAFEMEPDFLPPSGPSRGRYRSELVAHVSTDMPPMCPNNWVRHRWDFASMDTGGSAKLSFNDTSEVLFTPIAPGTYELMLTSASNCDSMEDTVEVEVLCNEPPTPSAYVRLSDWPGFCFPHVDLVGNASYDADGDHIEWTWTWVSLPNASATDELSVIGSEPNVVGRPDALGMHGVTFEVTDGCSTSQLRLAYFIAWEQECLDLGESRQSLLTLVLSVIVGVLVCASLPYMGPTSVLHVRNLSLDVQAVHQRRMAIRRLERLAAHTLDDPERSVAARGGWAVDMRPTQTGGASALGGFEGAANMGVPAPIAMPSPTPSKVCSPCKARGAFAEVSAHRAVRVVSMRSMGSLWLLRASPATSPREEVANALRRRWCSPLQWAIDVKCARANVSQMSVYMPPARRLALCVAVLLEPLQLLAPSFIRKDVPPFPYKLHWLASFLTGIAADASVANALFWMSIVLLVCTGLSFALQRRLSQLLVRMRSVSLQRDIGAYPGGTSASRKYSPGGSAKKSAGQSAGEDQDDEANSDASTAGQKDDRKSGKGRFAPLKSACMRACQFLLVAAVHLSKCTSLYVPAVLPEVLLQPMASALLGRVTCQYRHTLKPWVHWDKDPEVLCWQGSHFLQAVMAMAGFCVLVIAALLCGARRHEDDPGVRVLPSFVCLSVFAKVLIAGLGVLAESARRADADADFSTTMLWRHDVGVLLATGVLLAAHFVLQSVRGVARGVAVARAGGYSVATLAAAAVVWHKVSVGQSAVDDDRTQPVAILFWIIVLPVCVAISLLQWRCGKVWMVTARPSPSDTHANASMGTRCVAYVSTFSALNTRERKMVPSLSVSPLEALALASLVAGVMANDPGLCDGSTEKLLSQLGANALAFACEIEAKAITSGEVEIALQRETTSTRCAHGAAKMAAEKRAQCCNAAPTQHAQNDSKAPSTERARTASAIQVHTNELHGVHEGVAMLAERAIQAIARRALDPHLRYQMRIRWSRAAGPRATAAVCSFLQACATLLVHTDAAAAAAVAEAVGKLSSSDMLTDLIAADDIQQYKRERDVRGSCARRLAHALEHMRTGSISGKLVATALAFTRAISRAHGAMVILFRSVVRRDISLLAALVERAASQTDDSRQDRASGSEDAMAASDAALRAMNALATRTGFAAEGSPSKVSHEAAVDNAESSSLLVQHLTARGAARAALGHAVGSKPSVRSLAGALLVRCAQDARSAPAVVAAALDVVAHVYVSADDEDRTIGVCLQSGREPLTFARAMEVLQRACEVMPLAVGSLLSIDDVASLRMHLMHKDGSVRACVASVVGHVGLSSKGFDNLDSLDVLHILHRLEVADGDDSVRAAASAVLKRMADESESPVAATRVAEARYTATDAQLVAERREEVEKRLGNIKALVAARVDRDLRHAKGRVCAMLAQAHGDGNGHSSVRLPGALRTRANDPPPLLKQQTRGGEKGSSSQASGVTSSARAARSGLQAKMQAYRAPFAAQRGRIDFMRQLKGATAGAGTPSGNGSHLPGQPL